MEAELGRLLNNFENGDIIYTVMGGLYHPYMETPIVADNSSVTVILTGTIK